MISCKVLAVTDDPEARKGIVGDADYNMLWYCRADPRFQYWVRVPKCYLEDENRRGYKPVSYTHLQMWDDMGVKR